MNFFQRRRIACKLLAAMCILNLQACQRYEAMRVYAYVSPGAAQLLTRLNLNEQDLVGDLEQALKQRQLGAVAPNTVYDGATDALRLDLRRTQQALKIELSVRQGVSAQNMLERWSQTRLVPLPGDDALLRQQIKLALDQMLQDLAQQHGQAAYLQGQRNLE